MSDRPATHNANVDPTTADTAILSAFGLRTLAASLIGVFFGVGVLLLFTFSVFIQPIVESTGWPRTLVTAAIAPAALAIGLMSPLVGWLTDRFGPRIVTTVSTAALASALILIGLGSQSLAAFSLLIALASVLGSAQTPVPYSFLLAGWFKRKRGLAIGIALSGGGLGIAVVPFVTSLLIAWTDWRTAFILLGAALALITVPVAWFLVKDPPATSVAKGAEVPGVPLPEALRTPAFWVFFLAFLLNATAAAGGAISLPSLMSDRGIGAAGSGAAAMASVGLAAIAARIGFGALLDRLPPVLLTAFVLGAPILGHLLLLSNGGLWTIIVAAITFGIATGAEGDALSYLLSRRFGLRNFGRIFGLNFMGFALGTGFGPAFLSFVRERAGYDVAFITLAVIALVASVLIATQARRPLPYS